MDLLFYFIITKILSNREIRLKENFYGSIYDILSRSNLSYDVSDDRSFHFQLRGRERIFVQKYSFCSSYK